MHITHIFIIVLVYRMLHAVAMHCILYRYAYELCTTVISHTYWYVYIHIWMWMCVYTQPYICTYIHHINLYTHTYIHTCTHGFNTWYKSEKSMLICRNNAQCVCECLWVGGEWNVCIYVFPNMCYMYSRAFIMLYNAELLTCI